MSEIGHNNPPLDDPLEALKARADELKQAAAVWLDERPTITDQDMCDRAADYRAQIKALAKACDEKRTELVKPLNDKVKLINTDYKAVPKLLEAVDKMLGQRMAPFLEEQRRKIEEAQRKAREEAEAAKRAAEEAQRAAEEQGSLAALEAAQAAEAEAKEAKRQAAEANKQRAGAKGQYAPRAQSIRRSYSAKITDYRQALEHFAYSEEVKEAVQLAADRAAKQHKLELNVPGVEVIEDKKVV